MTPVERAARAVSEYMACGHCDGSCEDCTGEARTVFESIDVDELAGVLARLRFQEDMPYVIARAVVAHLTKGNENDE